MKKFTSYYLKIFVAGFVLVTIIVLYYYNEKLLTQTKEHNDWVTYTYRVMKESNELFDDIIDIENFYKEYLYSKDQKALMEYYQRKEKNRNGLPDLKNLVSDKNQKLRLDTLDNLYNKKVAILDSEVAKIYRNRSYRSELDNIDGIEDSLSDSIKAVIEDFNIHEQQLLIERSNRSSTSHREYYIEHLIGSAFVIIVFLVIFLFLVKEINKKRKSERELFIKTEWYNKILLSIGDAVITTDKNGIITFINKAAENITEWSEEESIGKNIDFVFQIFNGDSKEPAENPLKKALTDGKVHLLSNNSTLKTKTGKRIFIDDSAAPVFDDMNEIVGGVLIFRNIDEKTLFLKHLEAEKQKLNEILNNTNALVTIRDVEGNYLLVNKQYEKVMNVKKEDIVGKNVSNVHTVSDVYGGGSLTKILTASDEKIIKEKFIDSFEVELKLPDGKMHTLLFNKFPLLDIYGNVSAICSTANDITINRKNFENEIKLEYLENIQKSELKFLELIQNMPIMYFTMDCEFKVLFWNKTTEEFTGIKSSLAGGKKINDLFPEDTKLLEKNCKEVLESGKSKTFIFDFTLKGLDYTTEVTLYPTSGGVAGLSFDITDQRHTENATKELIESLQKRNNELKQFAYIISHNLRAPISKIQGLASLFDTEPDDAELNKTIIDNIKSSSDDLDTVVNDINTVISSRESEKSKYEFTIFEVELNFVKQILDDEIKKSDNALITMDFNKPSGMTTIKSSLHLIFLNLLSNAIKYKSPDRNLHVHFQATQDSDYVNISVEDNGIGIDLNKYGKKMFGMYKRFHENEADGRGLGLYLVKTQTEAMNGKVEVQSEINKGTKFTIRLPKK